MITYFGWARADLSLEAWSGPIVRANNHDFAMDRSRPVAAVQVFSGNFRQRKRSFDVAA